MRGRDLWQETPRAWASGGAGLWLNPRLSQPLCETLLRADYPELADHIWLAASGTSGSVKVVALARAALESSAAAVNNHLGAGPADCWLNPLPLFHVGGLGILVRAAMAGSRCEILQDWNAQEFVRRVAECGATLSSLVPAQVHDLVVAGHPAPPSLRAVVVGGGALDGFLHERAAELGWPLLPSYGLTEASSQVATAALGAPRSLWLPLLGHLAARVGEGDLLELRGPSLLTGWMIFSPDGSACWEDPRRDGWFRTSDRAELRHGELRFLGRADDLVKIRGELVDIAALERGLQARTPSGLVRIDTEPDERNGARLVVVAENTRTEAEARGADDLFPAYAKPSLFRVGPVELSPLGKKLRPAAPAH